MFNPQPKKGMPPKKTKKAIKRTQIKKKFKKPTGEKALFDEIWEEREHKCQVTGKPIYEFDIRLFSHILSKGAYGTYRLDKRNIWIVTPEIHHIWEFGDRSHPMFEKKREVLEQLKQEYYGQGKTKG